jgi:hypothetical protein
MVDTGVALVGTHLILDNCGFGRCRHGAVGHPVSTSDIWDAGYPWWYPIRNKIKYLDGPFLEQVYLLCQLRQRYGAAGTYMTCVLDFLEVVYIQARKRNRWRNLERYQCWAVSFYILLRAKSIAETQVVNSAALRSVRPTGVATWPMLWKQIRWQPDDCCTICSPFFPGSGHICNLQFSHSYSVFAPNSGFSFRQDLFLKQCIICDLYWSS